MLKAYKYRLLPSEAQKAQLAAYFGGCRFIFNLGLETKIAAYTSARKSLTYFDLTKQLVELKKTVPWLAECPAQGLQMSLRGLDNAFNKFFKGAGFPNFKKRHSRQSIQFPQSVRIIEDTIVLPKLRAVKFLQHRPIGEGKLKTVTVSKTPTGKYFVSILIDNHIELPNKKSVKGDTIIGIDMGIKTFATLSDGTSFENLRFLKKNLQRLRIEQRTLKRKLKLGSTEQSKGYQKQKLIVAKLHEKIRNQREDYLHKVSTSITKKYDTIVLENLNIKGMSQIRSLSLAVNDVGWYTFETFLKYKCEWYGKNLIYIGRFDPSSKICSTCGTINKELKLSDRVWTCKCGVTHDRDKNAAINIKNFGLRNQPNDANVVN